MIDISTCRGDCALTCDQAHDFSLPVAKRVVSAVQVMLREFEIDFKTADLIGDSIIKG